MNRQSTVEQDFFNFVDEAREDACEAIKSYYHSEEEIDVRIYYRRLACLIFEVCFKCRLVIFWFFQLFSPSSTRPH